MLEAAQRGWRDDEERELSRAEKKGRSSREHNISAKSVARCSVSTSQYMQRSKDINSNATQLHSCRSSLSRRAAGKCGASRLVTYWSLAAIFVTGLPTTWYQSWPPRDDLGCIYYLLLTQFDIAWQPLFSYRFPLPDTISIQANCLLIGTQRVFHSI